MSDELQHQLQCARDEELARVVAHIEAVAMAWEKLGDKALGVRFRMLAAALLTGAHRGASGDRIEQLARIMRAGGIR